MSSPSELPGLPTTATRPLGSVPSRPGSLVGLVRLSNAASVDAESNIGPENPSTQADRSPASPPALLLTIEEAAERLQVGRCTMQALLLSGEVQSFKIGRLRRVPPAALEAYIRRRMAP